MLTIFAIPRPFKGHFNTIQRNAIFSWTLLRPKCEIILFGDEEGTAKVAKEFNLRQIPEIETNEFGTPLLSDMFTKAQRASSFEIMARLNTDIILMSDFPKAIQQIQQIKKEPFLMFGQRWNLDIKEPIKFDSGDWEKKTRDQIAKEGELLGSSGMDYWIFPRNLPFDCPPFAIGRFATDGWLVYQARIRKMPIVDATQVINIIHQNHDRPQQKNDFYETERKRNIKLAGGYSCLMTLLDADWILTPEGLKKPPFPRRIFTELSLFPLWRYSLAIKRRLQHLKI